MNSKEHEGTYTGLAKKAYRCVCTQVTGHWYELRHRGCEIRAQENCKYPKDKPKTQE